MTADRFFSTAALRLAACFVALSLAACSVSEDGKIQCADDSSCPSDYPSCDTTVTPHVCRASTGTTPPTGDQVAIISVNGNPASATTPLRGTVRINVTAKADSGISSVTLTAGTLDATAVASATTPPLFAFDLDTTKIVDTTVAGGVAATLTATLTAGDKTTATANAMIFVDNTPPVITGPATPVPTLKTGSDLSFTFTASETLDLTTVKAVVMSGSTLVGNAAVTATSTPLTYQVDFGVTDAMPSGSYTVALSGSDLAGNATVTPVTVSFGVQAPVPLTSDDLKITTVANVVEGGLEAGTTLTTFTIKLTLPGSLTPAPTNGVVISVLLPSASMAINPSLTVAGNVYTATYPVGVNDKQGIATVTAQVTDVAGNQSSVSGQFFIDKSIPSLAGLASTPAFVLQGDQVTVTGIATKTLASATISTSTGDMGTCTCDRVSCGSDSTSAPLVTCVITVANANVATPPVPTVATVQLIDLLGNMSPAAGATGSALYETDYTVVNAASLGDGTASGLSAAKTIITVGTSTTLLPVFSNGQGFITASGTSIPPGPVSSGVPVSIAPLVDTTYTLTVTGEAGPSPSTQVLVKVVPPPTASVALHTGQSANVTKNDNVSFDIGFSGQANSSSVTVTKTSGSSTIAYSGPFTPGTLSDNMIQATTTYTVTSTNAAGLTASASVTVYVGAAPTISLFCITTNAAPCTSTSPTFTAVTQGTSLQLLPTYNSATGSGVISRSDSTSVSNAPSGTPFNTGVLNAPGTLTFTLTVTNTAGASASSTIVVDVLPTLACATAALVATPASITVGTSSMLTATIPAGGVGMIDFGSGPVTVASGVAVTVSPAATKTYTLKVSDQATTPNVCANSPTATVTVVGMPTLSGALFSVTHPQATLNPSLITAGTLGSDTYTFTIPTIANGSTATITEGGRSYSTSAGILGVSGSTLPNVPVQPAAVTSPGFVTFTLTVTNSLNVSVAETATIQVVAAPTVGTFTISPTTVTNGSPAIANASFSGGTGVISGTNSFASTAITAGVAHAIIPPPSATTVFTLTVTDAAGDAAGTVPFGTTRSVTAVAAPVLSGTVFAVAHPLAVLNPQLITQNSPMTDTYVFSLPAISGGTAAITDSAGASYSDSATILAQSAGTLTVNVKPSSLAATGTLTFTLTLTNAATTAVSEAASLKVIAAPSVQAFSATPSAVTVGTPVTVSATFVNGTNGTAKVSAVNGSVTTASALGASPASFSFTPTLGTTVLSLTVTNAAGDSAGTINNFPSVSVTAVAAPLLTGAAFAVSHPQATLNPSLITALAGNATTTDTYSFTIPTLTNGQMASISDGTRTYSTSGAIINASGSTLLSVPVQPAAITAPGTTLTFTLTLTNSASFPVSQTATLQVVAAPTVSAFGANPVAVNNGSATTLTAAYLNGSGVVTGKNASGTVTVASLSVPSGATGVSVVPPAGTSAGTATIFNLVVTNAAGDAAGTLNYATPVTVTSFAPATLTGPAFSVTHPSSTLNPKDITGGSTDTLSFTIPTITNATTTGVTIKDSAGNSYSTSANIIAAGAGTGVLTNVAIPAGALAAAQNPATVTFTLQAVNANSVPVSETDSMTVVPPPTVGGFTASPLSGTNGASVNFTATFNNGAAKISGANFAPITVLTAVATAVVPPFAAGAATTTVFSLTVTDPAGDPLGTLVHPTTVSVTAYPLPTETSFIISSVAPGSSGFATVASNGLTAVTTGGAPVPSFSWSANSYGGCAATGSVCSITCSAGSGGSCGGTTSLAVATDAPATPVAWPAAITAPVAFSLKVGNLATTTAFATPLSVSISSQNAPQSTALTIQSLVPSANSVISGGNATVATAASVQPTLSWMATSSGGCSTTGFCTITCASGGSGGSCGTSPGPLALTSDSGTQSWPAAVTAPVTFSLVIKNQAGAPAGSSASASITTTPVASIASGGFSGPSVVAEGANLILTLPTFSASTTSAAVQVSSVSVTGDIHQNASVSLPAPTGTTTYTLIATNLIGQTATLASVTVRLASSQSQDLLPSSLYGATATTFIGGPHSGKIFIAGGAPTPYSINAAVPAATGSQVFIYDQSSGSVTTLAVTMKAPRAFHTATAMPGGKVLLAGGNLTGPTYEVYDDNSTSFTAVGSGMTSLCLHGAAVLDANAVGIFGGTDCTNQNAGSKTVTIVNITTLTVTSIANVLSVARALPAVTALGSSTYVLVAGGFTGGATSTALSSVDLINYTAGTPSVALVSGTAGALSATRVGATASQFSTTCDASATPCKVLVAGGGNGTADELSVTSTAVSLSMTDNMISARQFQAATVLTGLAGSGPAGTSLVLLSGGMNAGATLSSVEVFDPGTHSFAAGSPMAYSRQQFQAPLVPVSGTPAIVVFAGGAVAKSLVSTTPTLIETETITQ